MGNLQDNDNFFSTFKFKVGEIIYKVQNSNIEEFLIININLTTQRYFGDGVVCKKTQVRISLESANDGVFQIDSDELLLNYGKTRKEAIELELKRTMRTISSLKKQAQNDDAEDKYEFIGHYNDEDEFTMDESFVVGMLLNKYCNTVAANPNHKKKTFSLKELYEKYGEYSVIYHTNDFIAFSMDGMDGGVDVYEIDPIPC